MPSEVAAIPRGCLINGKWIARGEVSEVRSPYDGSVVGAVHLATKEDVEAAIQAAVAAFEITKKLGSYQRKEVLQKISSRLENRREEFARSIALEAASRLRRRARKSIVRFLRFPLLPKKRRELAASICRSTGRSSPPDAGVLRSAFRLDRLPRSLPLIFL